MKNEYYIPNTSGEKISFDGKEYILRKICTMKFSLHKTRMTRQTVRKFPTGRR